MQFFIEINFQGMKSHMKDHMSLVMRKLVFRIFDHVQHKPGCAATEDG